MKNSTNVYKDTTGEKFIISSFKMRYKGIQCPQKFAMRYPRHEGFSQIQKIAKSNTNQTIFCDFILILIKKKTKKVAIIGNTNK